MLTGWNISNCYPGSPSSNRFALDDAIMPGTSKFSSTKAKVAADIGGTSTYIQYPPCQVSFYKPLSLGIHGIHVRLLLEDSL
jgi:hypothetical protein